jgi:F420-non-reducing hydrogenase iron-sulfur subunit
LTKTSKKAKATKKNGQNFEPRIIAFCCNWCSYAGADLAGTSRMQMPSNVRVIRVNCTGRIDPIFILQALEGGVDGVLISGCHEGECHYVEGNIHSKKRFNFFKKILDQMGLGNRIIFEHISASEGTKYAEIIANFVKNIQDLGPTPVKDVSNPTDLYIDEKHSRKDRIHDLLVSIGRRVGYEPKKPLKFDPEEVVEGYGFPKRDPEKCIGCYACYNICPEKAITIEDVKNKRRYGTLHASCLLCKECEKICPQEAIEIAPGFELLSFLLKEPLWEFEVKMQKCSVCKEYFNPIPFCDELEKTLISKKADGSISELNLPFNPYTTCPECKRKKIAQSFAEVAQPAMIRRRKS